MNDPSYRKWIREALATASPFAVPEKALQDAVRSMAGDGFDLSVHRRAIEWNLSQDYIQSATNADTDNKEWRLTKRGAAKESE